MENFSKQTGMTINTSKTTYTKKSDGEEQLKWKETSIEKGSSNVVISVPKHEPIRMLGVHYNLDLNFEHQEKLSLQNLIRDLAKIKNRCFTTNQKVKIINLMLTPRITSKLNTILYSPETLKKMDEKIKRMMCQTIGIPQTTCGETLWRRHEDMGINLNSIVDEQIQAFLATAINHGLNSPNPFPRRCLEQRLLDIPNMYDFENIKKTQKMSLVNIDFWTNLKRIIGTLRSGRRKLP